MKIVKVQTHIGQIKFKQINPTAYHVSCAGQPTLQIARDHHGMWEGSPLSGEEADDAEDLAFGSSAKQCYQRTVNAFWEF